uniref:RILP-like protein 2 n=1 Tax=Callorhinchus milii TaxID=7868 RepID=V9L9B5_CALMI
MEDLEPASAFDKDPFELTAEDVYDISYVIGRELMKVSSPVGCPGVSELQYKIIRVLEMFESLVNKHNLTVEELKMEQANLKAETERLHRELQKASSETRQSEDKASVDLADPNRPRFTLGELREVLQERNELKAKLLVVQEELQYYKNSLVSSKEASVIERENASTASRGSEQTMIKKLFNFKRRNNP